MALGTDATRIPYYISSGFLPEQYYHLIPFLFVTAFLGSYVGKKIVTKIDLEIQENGLNRDNPWHQIHI